MVSSALLELAARLSFSHATQLKPTMTAAASPIRPGIPSRAAGAKPISSARLKELLGIFVIATASAKLAARPEIMMNPSAMFEGSAKGSLAADNDMSALYLISRQNTRLNRSMRLAGDVLRNSVVSSAVDAMDNITATFAGQICAPSQ